MSSTFRQLASIALNVLLAVTVFSLAVRRWHRAPASPVMEASPEVGTKQMPAFVRRPTSPVYTETASASDRRRQLVDQLRAMGVPNNILARIVLADLDKEWNKHGAEVALKCRGDTATMVALQLEIDMNKDAEMRAALGEEGFKQWDQENMVREAMIQRMASSPGGAPQSLTDAGTNAVYDLKKQLQQRELELRQALQKGEMDNADVSDAYERAMTEYSEQMKTLLADEQYAKSRQGDGDTAADSLRQDFAKANPSDPQFQELLKTQQQWNEQRSALGKQFQDDPGSAAYAGQLKALDDARDQEYRRVLGADVFDTLQKEQDGGYMKMKKYENLWGLDDASLDSVYGAMQYYQKSIQDYQARAHAVEAQGQSVDWEAVERNVQRFKEQTGQSLQNYLGQQRYDKLQRNGVFYQFDEVPHH